MSDVRNAVYYDYEGETLIITRNKSGVFDNIEIEAYRHIGGEDDGASLFLVMTHENWEELVKRVRDLN